MGFSSKTGISLASGFKYHAKSPLDLRRVVDTIAERDELVTIDAAWEGMHVYVKDDKTTYEYRGGTTWIPVLAGVMYSHPTYTAKANGLYKVTVDGTGHVSSTVAVTKADITALGIPGSDTKYEVFKAATADAAGGTGLVPAPAKGAQGLFLRGDNVWAKPADTTYNDATTSAHGLMTAADKTKLNGIAEGANKYTHPASHSIDMITETTDKKVMTAAERTKLAGIAAGANNYTHPSSHALSMITETDDLKIMTADERTKLAGIDTGANNYTHPTYAAKTSGLYKVTVDATGHVSAVAAVTKADITALGIPGQDTNTTYNAATATTPGLMTAADKVKLDGITAGANKYTYTHPSSGVTAGTYKSVTVDAQGHVTGGSNPTTLAGYGITDAAKSSHSHKAADITDNIPASKISGVLSLDNIPKAALERQVPVADDTARFKLTANDVQNGDVVKVKSTGLMYFVTDQTKLSSADGYMEFTAGSAASVPWTGITGKPTTFLPTSHTHSISDISNLQDALNGKAANKNMTAATTDAAGTAGLVPAPAAGKQGLFLRGDGTWNKPTDTTYNDATTSTHGLMTAADKVKLNGIATGANNYTHPSSHPLSMITETDSLKVMTAAERTKLAGIAAGANNYSHPAYTAKASGLYKVTVDATGHVSAVAAVTKADITALGIPGQDTNTTYNDATTSAHGLMTAADKTKLNGIAANANNYTHPGYTAKASGLYKVTVDATGHVSAVAAVTKSDITALGIPGSDTNTDTKVTQTAIKSSDYTNWRTVLWGSSNSATEGFAPGTVTDGVFSDANLTYQPSTGTLKAKIFKGSLSGNASTASNVAWSGVTGRPSSMPASDVYAWAKASSKPSYSKSEVGLGNVDNTADSAKSVKYATSAGSAGSATKATQDSGGQQINKTYIKSLSVSGRTITYTRGDNTTGTITTQDTDTNTWRPVQNNLTSTATDQSLSAAQGKILNDHVQERLVRSEWNCTIKCATWSRLCYVAAKTGVTGSSFIINVSATRGNVVYHDTFVIKVHHSSSALISKISGSKYPSSIQIRVLANANGDCYVELYDAANSATNSTTQSVNCTLLQISCGALTKYTSFTNGSSIPSGYSNAATLVTNSNSLQGNLTWGEITGKPGSMPASDVYAWAKASSKPSYSKGEVGLGNVDNTADSAKSVKYAASAGAVAWSNVSGRPSSMPASDVYSWAKASSKPSYSKSEVGLGNVDNTADSAKSVKYATSAGSAGSASNVKDSGDSNAITFAYSKAGLNYGDYTWLAGWNGREMRAVNKNQFATSGHTHNYAGKSSKVSATLSASSWSGSGPYSITVSVSGVTASNNVEVLIPGSATDAQVEAWMAAGIVNGTQTTNSITLKAYGDKPSINIPIECIVRKDI